MEEALLAKRDAARAAGLGFFIINQFAFEPAPILAWLRRVRALGIDAPVRLGVAGPASVATLVRFGLRCGVGASLNAVRVRPNTVGRLLGRAGPEELLTALARALAGEADANVSGIHFFPFGGIAETGDFVVRLLEQLYREVAADGQNVSRASIR
jgi:methylenetetrahydrofolate reductase (NADPH)